MLSVSPLSRKDFFNFYSNPPLSKPDEQAIGTPDVTDFYILEAQAHRKFLAAIRNFYNLLKHLCVLA